MGLTSPTYLIINSIYIMGYLNISILSCWPNVRQGDSEGLSKPNKKTYICQLWAKSQWSMVQNFKWPI
jgi:hypothetical protein